MDWRCNRGTNGETLTCAIDIDGQCAMTEETLTDQTVTDGRPEQRLSPI